MGLISKRFDGQAELHATWLIKSEPADFDYHMPANVTVEKLGSPDTVPSSELSWSLKVKTKKKTVSPFFQFSVVEDVILLSYFLPPPCHLPEEEYSSCLLACISVISPEKKAPA